MEEKLESPHLPAQAGLPEQAGGGVVREVDRLYAIVSRWDGRRIRVSTADRSDSPSLRPAPAWPADRWWADRYAETLVWEGAEIIDRELAPAGSEVGHRKMISKWSNPPMEGKE